MNNIVFIAVDWGTTSFRLWAMARDGDVIAERHGGFGMSTLKPADFEPVLEDGVDGTVCLPGTHSKWARIEAGSVTRFCTAGQSQ